MEAELKPWAKWMIKHKMRYLLVFWMYIIFPLYLLVYRLNIENDPYSEATIQWSSDIDYVRNVQL